MTLDELLKDKTLPVKVRRDLWDIKYLSIEHVMSNGEYAVLTATGHANCIKGDGYDWELYTEPKKKRVMYQALVSRPGWPLKVTEELFESEAEGKAWHRTGDYEFVCLLTERAIEVECE